MLLEKTRCVAINGSRKARSRHRGAITRHRYSSRECIIDRRLRSTVRAILSLKALRCLEALGRLGWDARCDTPTSPPLLLPKFRLLSQSLIPYLSWPNWRLTSTGLAPLDTPLNAHGARPWCSMHGTGRCLLSCSAKPSMIRPPSVGYGKCPGHRLAVHAVGQWWPQDAGNRWAKRSA